MPTLEEGKTGDGSVRRLEDPIELQIWECDALTRVSLPLLHEEFNADLRDFTDRLTAFLQSSKGGVGIAANQVGVLRRLFVMSNKGEIVVACNPAVEVLAPTHSFELEGCLSLPGVFQQVCRADNIRLSFQTVEGVPKTLGLRGLEAHIALHELDHLDGRMFFDRQNMNRQMRKAVERAWSKCRPLAKGGR